MVDPPLRLVSKRTPNIFGVLMGAPIFRNTHFGMGSRSATLAFHFAICLPCLDREAPETENGLDVSKENQKERRTVFPNFKRKPSAWNSVANLPAQSCWSHVSDLV